ncbi:MAG: 30S ribosomal protein S11 [bacterium]|jgi:small subunit ribosomal protein S11|nr:30S ribosomal protein S11 [bacterium]MDD5529018.1 30S ribosomal protein S11 [bacterium]
MAKKKIRRVDPNGIIHIYATFNNTIVTVTDMTGNCLSWASSGSAGFKGTRKGTPFAASLCAKKCVQDVVNAGMKRVEIWLKGPGSGRDPAVRSIKGSGLKIITIKDLTPLPHNGCRPPKPRRV